MTLPPVPDPEPDERTAKEERKRAIAKEMGPRHEQAMRVREATKGLGLASVGLTLALSVGIGIALGIWLDNTFRTGGLLVILFTLLGIIAGFKELIQAVIRAGKDQDRK